MIVFTYLTIILHTAEANSFVDICTSESGNKGHHIASPIYYVVHISSNHYTTIMDGIKSMYVMVVSVLRAWHGDQQVLGHEGGVRVARPGAGVQVRI